MKTDKQFWLAVLVAMFAIFILTSNTSEAESKKDSKFPDVVQQKYAIL